MSPVQKATRIFLNTLPIVVMVGHIPIIQSDVLLALLYVGIIAIALMIRYEERDWLFFLFGFCIMIASELFFISTGVETFERRSLLGAMPLWLPVLWGYGFVAMRRAIVILEQ